MAVVMCERYTHAMSDNLSPYSSSQYEEGMLKTMPYYESIYFETISLIRYLRPNVYKWLDTGCGTGSLISRAYPVFEGTKYFLADPSEEMLNKAQQALSKIPTSQLEILGSIGTENLPDHCANSPQVITAILAHHYFARKEREIATKRCFHLLEKDGLYITFENIYPSSEEAKEIGLGRWKQFQMSKGKSEEEANRHISRYNKSFFPVTVDEHLKILKDAGFRIAELFWYSNMQAGFYAIK